MALSTAEDVFTGRLTELRQFALRNGLDDVQIRNCIDEVLRNNVANMKRKCGAVPSFKTTIRYLFYVLIAVFLFYLLLSYHVPSQKFVSRYVQTLIYPFMRYLRLVTLPVNRLFPEISGWHERQCIVLNPFYRNPELSCWPCKNIHAVVDLTDFRNSTTAYYRNGTPFVIKKSSIQILTLPMLKDLMRDNAFALRKGTLSFYSSSSCIRDMDDIEHLASNLNICNDLHIEWQFRRVSAARVLRTVFSRPHFVPNTTEVSLQRYIFIDGSSSQRYALPVTEFANVYLMQGTGKRRLVLLPSPHCANSCSIISSTLYPGDILFYNWQFWRATFFPSENSVTITYMGSFY